MKRLEMSLCFFCMLIVLILPGAQIYAQEFQPSVGQEGKDVIWVPTPESLIEAMLDLAKVTPEDYVADLGSGDGRIVIAAAKRGAKAVGFEFNPDMVALSRRNAEKAGVSDKASFVQGDLFESDFSKATVVTMYLLPQLNLKLRPTLLEMKPGTRVVSHAFTMGEWTPDQTIEQEGRTAYLWIVPAHVEGTWVCNTPSGNAELTLTQQFQMVQGTLRRGNDVMTIAEGRLEGAHIHFTAGKERFSGVVNGRQIEGTVTVGTQTQKWSAVRTR